MGNKFSSNPPDVKKSGEEIRKNVNNRSLMLQGNLLRDREIYLINEYIKYKNIFINKVKNISNLLNQIS